MASSNYYKDRTFDNLGRIKVEEYYQDSQIIKKNYNYLSSGYQTSEYVSSVNITGGYYSNPNTTIGNLTYTYDGLGNIKTITDTFTNNTISYTYDTLGRITRENNSKCWFAQ